MTLGRAGAALAAVLLATAAAPAQAQRDNPLIRRGQSEYDELRFEEALQTLSAALVRSGNSPRDLARIYRLLAFTYLALDRREEASGAYGHMLGLDPEFQPGEEVAPRVRAFFGQVRERWEAAGRPGSSPPPPVTIRHRSPAQAEIGQEVPLEATTDDDAGRVEGMVLAYRRGTNAVFRRLDCRREGGTWRATIPGDDVGPPLVEYYFEAIDAQGLPVAARGDVAAPLRITVPEPGGGINILEEWWFWLGVGVLAAGGVVLGVVLATEGGGGPQTGTLVVTIE